MRWPSVSNRNMPDDLVAHLSLDENVIARLPIRRARERYVVSKWTQRIDGLIADIIDARAVWSVRRLALFAVGMPLVGAVAWFTWYWESTGRFIESTDDAYVGGDVTTLSTKVAGFIGIVAVTDNQLVRAGDLLLKLDDRDYRAQLARAEASVAVQQAALANIEATRRMQQAMIEQASADVAAAAAELTRAKYDIERYRILSNDRFASRQRFEQADADHEKARAAERRTRAALAAAERQLEVIDAQQKQAEAALDQARADRDLAQLNLGYSEIHAPIDGVVGNRSARAGAYAAVGTQLLAIVPAQGLWVDANFKEGQLARMRDGQAAEIIADVTPGARFRGRVASLAPATGAQFSIIPPENATGNFTKIVQRVPVKITIDPNDPLIGQLRPGMSVEPTIDTSAKTE
jgi:membrane fusion protein, multidrug efflux system